VEAIIIIIISSIIGYFLKNKGEEASETPPPVNRRMQRVEPKKLEQTMRRKLDEVTKTVLHDIEKKTPKPDELKKQATQMLGKVEQPVEKKIFERAERTATDRSAIMQTAVKKSVPKKESTTSTGFTFPKNSNELAQAFVMAEILGPPKSKR